MHDLLPDDSVGLVKSQTFTFSEGISLRCGRTLPFFQLIFETYGELNEEKSNAILVCHALSGDQHAAGYYSMEDRKPGWWETCIGPRKPIDTKKFFIVSCNNLGGCGGSSGPNTVNPATGKLFAGDFPIVTVEDWVHSQMLLGERLGIAKWAAVIGGSLGGMQVMQWSIDYPDKISHAVVIAATSKLSTQNIAFNEVARQAIISDPCFKKGNYYADTPPHKGLMLARMLGHITYLSEESLRIKFGRELKRGRINYDFDEEFQIESYLRYKGKSFVHTFDANTYLLMTRVLDYFDPSGAYDGDLVAAFSKACAQFFVVAFSSDWRFPPQCSKEIVQGLLKARKRVTYACIDSPYGHDSFLMSISEYMNVLGSYMTRIYDEIK